MIWLFHDGEGEWPSTPAVTLHLLISLNTDIGICIDSKQGGKKKRKKCPFVHKPGWMHYFFFKSFSCFKWQKYCITVDS